MASLGTSLCGTFAVDAVLAALVRRRDAGEGTFESVPDAQLTGTSRPALGKPLYGSYGTDMALRVGKQVIVMAPTRRQWRGLVATTGSQGLVQLLGQELGADVTDEGARFTHRDLLNVVLRPWFPTRTLEEVSAALSGTSVLWAPFRQLTDLAQDLVAGLAAPAVARLDDVDIGTVLASSGPIRRPSEPPRSQLRHGFSAGHRRLVRTTSEGAW